MLTLSNIVTLTQVEVERHESSPRMPVSQRHDLTFQPLTVPAIAMESHEIDVDGIDERSLTLYSTHST